MKVLSHNPTHSELQELKLELQTAVERQLIPIEIEADSIKIIHLLERK